MAQLVYCRTSPSDDSMTLKEVISVGTTRYLVSYLVKLWRQIYEGDRGL